MTVRVPERLTRSPRWEIIGATQPFEQPDGVTIVFEVEVPPGEDVLLTYIVVYIRPT